MVKKAVKRFLVFGLILALSIVGFPSMNNVSVYATTKTQADAIAWVKSQVGKSIDYDGAYGAQCVDLIKAYYNYLGVSPVSGNGKDYATNALPSGWSRMAGVTPQPGDILVYGASASNSFGHVAIYESERSTYHQNFDNKPYVQHITYAYNGLLNPYWGVIRPNWSSPSATGNNPQGCIDYAEGREGSIWVRGWTFDRDSVGTQLDVHVYIGGAAGSGAEGHVIKANKERTDVNGYYGVGNYHGFDETITTNRRGIQEVYIYAINVGGGGNILLGHKTVQISENIPHGFIDNAEGQEGAVRVRGWAFDRDNVNTQIAVHVYIGGAAGAGGEGHAIKADKERTDVNQKYGVGNYHGFDDIITTNLTGVQEVYFYAINIGGAEMLT